MSSPLAASRPARRCRSARGRCPAAARDRGRSGGLTSRGAARSAFQDEFVEPRGRIFQGAVVLDRGVGRRGGLGRARARQSAALSVSTFASALGEPRGADFLAGGDQHDETVAIALAGRGDGARGRDCTTTIWPRAIAASTAIGTP